jgi:hypothetical protein
MGGRGFDWGKNVWAGVFEDNVPQTLLQPLSLPRAKRKKLFMFLLGRFYDVIKKSSTSLIIWEFRPSHTPAKT